MTLPERLLKAAEAASARPWIENDDDGYGIGSIWSRMTPSGSGPPGPHIADVIGDSAEADANIAFIVLAANSAEYLARVAVAAEALVAKLEPFKINANAFYAEELAALTKLLGEMG